MASTTFSPEQNIQNRTIQFTPSDGRSLDLKEIRDQLGKISEIKLESYENISNGKFENTVNDMVNLIHRLERHLMDVINVNSAIRKDLDVNLKEKKQWAELKSDLEEKLNKATKEIPLNKDLEKRLNLTISEVNKFRQLQIESKAEAGRLKDNVSHLNLLVRTTREERDDAYREIVALENKLEKNKES